MKANLKANKTAKTTHPPQSISGQASTLKTGATPSGQSAQSPSVPISVYRDLADELNAANHHVNLLTAQNQTLRQQNQSLRAEVVRIIESAAALQRLLQTNATLESSSSGQNNTANQTVRSQPLNYVSSQSPAALNRQEIINEIPFTDITDEVIAELDKTLIAQIDPSLLTSPQADLTGTSSEEIKVYGPYCNLPLQGRSGQGSSSQDLNPQTVGTQFFTEYTLESLIATGPNLLGDMDNDKVKPINGLWLTLTLVVVIVTAFSAGFLVVLPFIQVDNE